MQNPRASVTPPPSAAGLPPPRVRRWRRWQIAALVLVVLAGAAVAVSAVVLGYDGPCPPAAPQSASATTMRAVTYRCYGSADVLSIEDVERPRPARDQILVRVHAAAVNPVDWHFMHGTPYIMRVDAGIGRPTNPRLGGDFSGVVEAVGSEVTNYRPGDAVFGSRSGALAEYVTVGATRAVVPVPAGVSLEEAAGVPVAAVTALQALRDHARVRPGQRVLVNGASGGVGTFAVQIAKAFGAEVTGVSSTRNLALVQSLGADHVIDYTREDFTAGSVRYDAIIDAVGNRTPSDMRRVLTPDGVCVLVGGGGPERSLFGPLTSVVRAAIYGRFVRQSFVFFIAEVTHDNLQVLRQLMEEGAVRPVIDRRYPLEQAAEAIRYLETGRARGKVLVTMTSGTTPASD